MVDLIIHKDRLLVVLLDGQVTPICSRQLAVALEPLVVHESSCAIMEGRRWWEISLIAHLQGSEAPFAPRFSAPGSSGLRTRRLSVSALMPGAPGPTTDDSADVLEAYGRLTCGRQLWLFKEKESNAVCQGVDIRI